MVKPIKKSNQHGMTLHLRTLQWNIGGGKIRTTADGPYDRDGLDCITQFIIAAAPDIITLQETHSNTALVQADVLAAALGWPSAVKDIYAPSHVEAGQELGQAVLSRWPITSHQFLPLPNPGLSITLPDGRIQPLHDKGVTRCIVDIAPGQSLEVVTLHLFPFRKLGIDPFDVRMAPVRETLTEATLPACPLWLMQGDFNLQQASLKTFLPDLFAAGADEFILPAPTTPRGGLYDHVAFRNMKLATACIDSTLPTDHYPIICDFSLCPST